MTKNSFNMHTFSHSIYLDESLNEVYKYIGTANGLAKWFIGKSVYSSDGEIRNDDEYVKTGDEFKWDWLEKNHSITGVVLDSEPNKSLRFTFGSLFKVTISVKEDKGRTLLTLSQEYNAGVIPDDFAHINCCVCWAFFITNLKSVIEFGNDLRETRADNEELVNR